MPLLPGSGPRRPHAREFHRSKCSDEPVTEPQALDDIATFTFATSKLDAASIVAASFRRDLLPAQNLGFMGTAYSATHEATELILKIYLGKCLGRNPREFRDHHLGRMFDAWAPGDRESAELAYQREIGDELIERFERAGWAAAGIDPLGILPPDFDERKSEYESRITKWRNELLGKTPSAGAVVSELDRQLGVPNIRELCGTYGTTIPVTRVPQSTCTRPNSSRWNGELSVQRRGTGNRWGW